MIIVDLHQWRTADFGRAIFAVIVQIGLKGDNAMENCLSALVSIVLWCGPCFVPPPQGDPVYFLVGEIVPSHHDSYVLALYDPVDIAHARALLGPDPPIETIVNARIAREADLINRNYLEPGLPTWSWCVCEFEAFSWGSIEICDGWPGWVEDCPACWPTDSGICFWQYTVVAELGPDLEPWNCNLDVDDDVDFEDFAIFAQHWGESGCGHRYWCGGADLDFSGSVDVKDLAILAKNWLWSSD